MGPGLEALRTIKAEANEETVVQLCPQLNSTQCQVFTKAQFTEELRMCSSVALDNS